MRETTRRQMSPSGPIQDRENVLVSSTLVSLKADQAIAANVPLNLFTEQVSVEPGQALHMIAEAAQSSGAGTNQMVVRLFVDGTLVGERTTVEVGNNDGAVSIQEPYTPPIAATQLVTVIFQIECGDPATIGPTSHTGASLRIDVVQP